MKAAYWNGCIFQTPAAKNGERPENDYGKTGTGSSCKKLALTEHICSLARLKTAPKQLSSASIMTGRVFKQKENNSFQSDYSFASCCRQKCGYSCKNKQRVPP
ncbi:hypothetical protein L21SP3_02031 [Sedimentisphaera cyanobacteriorum]|uniref:Uncharacterized protein n=1 Tax=Sedimentisphaera cyanobacteriorum TaxID=1940790 RepID=A0A1Q2HSJ8_9BACT|nr:hypothetical protein [Sedimentisphaera cyanobacteriorum]AQQ10203.1 hypothetical protein L21SP3_02031 [Sedimentisphaera cyanobacteriorum]